MKFKKLKLDESLFDDSNNSSLFDSDDFTIPGYDDDFSAPEYMPKMDHTADAPKGPKAGSDYGISELLISSINDEWETIKKYNDLIATLRSEASKNPIYDSMIAVIDEINAEENRHVGQLQELLKTLSPNVNEIAKGEAEGREQLRFVNGKLPVQTVEPYPSAINTDNPNQVADTCTIFDIDDEM